MKVIVEEAAAADLDDAIRWISADSPRAAAKMRRRIVARNNQLSNSRLSGMGRPGRIEGTRELLAWPYVIIYTVDKAAGQILVRASFMAQGTAPQNRNPAPRQPQF
ncbi:MAG: type II toxin-antitoxin system RelE/ParE family toxin [Tardiphaga sp.]